MSASLSGEFNLQAFTDLGDPLIGGRLYTYTFGTTTHKTAYTDQAGVVPHTYTSDGLGGQYIALNARGELPAPLFLLVGAYDLALKTQTGATVWTRRAIGTADAGEAAAAALTASLDTTSSAAAASLLDFTQSGGGANQISLNAKLQQFVSRAEFPTDAAFNAAKGTRPNVDGSGNFDAPVTPSAEPTQLQLAKAVQPVAAGPRDAIAYDSATSVKVFRNHAVMGGFRFRGQYTKGRAPCFPMPASKIASVSTGLGAEAAARSENWYAVFACANNGDATATLKVMPFLRAGTVSGSNVALIKAGEGIHALTAQTYAWSAANNLAGTDCLVISEGGNFSGRVTTITANSSSQITLANVGSVAAYDFLLPAPPNFTNYVYLGSFYFDTAEVRNIYDSGSLVKAKMVFLQQPAAALTGAVTGPPGVSFDCAGYISPLATSVAFDSSCSLSTATSGGFAEYFDPDGGNHIVDSRYEVKATATTETVVFSNIQIPFLYYQKFWYSNGGNAGIPANRISGQFNITGWIEP